MIFDATDWWENEDLNDLPVIDPEPEQPEEDEINQRDDDYPDEEIIALELLAA